jgi:hypothetical protein
MKKFVLSFGAIMASILFAVCTGAAHLMFAIVQNPVTGRTRKKMANVVFSRIFGKNTMRAKPLSVANPRSDGQVSQRGKFSLCVQSLRYCIGFLQVGYKHAASGMSAFNKAVMDNFHTIVTGTYPSLTVDWSLAVLAKGSLTGASNPLATGPAGHKVTFTWDNNTGEGDAQASDIAMLIAIDPISKNSTTSMTSVLRSAGTADLVVPAKSIGHSVYCYIAFKDALNKKVSDSTYIAAVPIIA